MCGTLLYMLVCLCFSSCCFVKIRSVYIQCRYKVQCIIIIIIIIHIAPVYIHVHCALGYMCTLSLVGCQCVCVGLLCVCVCHYVYRLLRMFVLLLTCINIFCLLSHSNFASLDTRNHLPYLTYISSPLFLSPSLPYPLSIFVIFIFHSF